MRIQHRPSYSLDWISPSLPLYWPSLCLTGLGLYTASGALSIVHNGFLPRYVTVVVTMGCPGGFQYPDSIFANAPLYCAALQPNYEFKDTSGFPVWLGFLWVMGLLVVLALYWAWVIILLTWCSRPSLLLTLFKSSRPGSTVNHRELKRSAILFTIGITTVGGVLATGSVAIMTSGITESFLDCRNAQQQSYGYTGCIQTSISLPASPSGHFTIWSMHWEAIVRSMFV